MILSVRPLGALHLSLRQIPSPSLRASYEQETLLSPLPSTILGALGTAMGIRLTGRNDQDYWLSELYSSLRDLFGSDFTLWGPLIKLRGKDREYFVAINNELYPLDQVDRYIDYLQRRYQGIRNEKHELKTLQSWSTNKIGIHINVETKTVDEGHLYLIRLASAARENFIEYIYELDGVRLEPKKTVVRLGGESRLAILELRDERKFLHQDRTKYHILLSPCILPLSGERGTIDVNSLTGKGGSKVKRVYGRPELLGIGFSEVSKRRRPLMAQLPPGTVIMFDVPESSKSWIGNLTKYGFGSIIGVR